MIKQVSDGFWLMVEAIRRARTNIYLPIVARFVFGRRLANDLWLSAMLLFVFGYLIQRGVLTPLGEATSARLVAGYQSGTLPESTVGFFLLNSLINLPNFLLNPIFLLSVYIIYRLRKVMRNQNPTSDVDTLRKSTSGVFNGFVLLLFVLGISTYVVSELIQILIFWEKHHEVGTPLFKQLFTSSVVLSYNKSASLTDSPNLGLFVTIISELFVRVLDAPNFICRFVFTFSILYIFRSFLKGIAILYVLNYVIMIITSIPELILYWSGYQFDSNLMNGLFYDFIQRPFSLLVWLLACSFLLPVVKSRVGESLSEDSSTLS
jgi:hypothetical protein